MSPRTARWIARLVLGGYLILASAGFVLQLVSGTTYMDLGVPFVVAASVLVAVWSSIAVLIIHKKPKHPIGWIMLFALIAWGLDSASFGTVSYLQRVDASYPLIHDLTLIWLAISGFPISLLGFTFIFLLFPTGDYLSRSWARVGRIAAAACGAYIVLVPFSPETTFSPSYRSPLAVDPSLGRGLNPLVVASMAGLFLCLVAAALSLVLRYRRSRGEIRQQMKIFLLSAAIFPLHVPPTAYVIATGRIGLVFYAGLVLLLSSFLAMALAIAISILRHRLFDIDLVINRTIVYSIVTGVLALLYVASVLILQSLFTMSYGQQSPLAVVGSTLMIAALFQPLRSRVQRYVDQRFYRRRYDAQRLVQQFSATLRSEVDPETISELLVEAVQSSLQPSHLSIWLRR